MKRTIKDVWMTFLIVFAMVASLFAIYALVMAPSAKADANDYLWHLRTNPHVNFFGTYANPAGFLDLGERICYDLYSLGIPQSQVISNVYWNPSWNFDWTAAEEVVYEARDHLC